MAHPLTTERFLKFVLVRNISPTLDETSAKNMLIELFASQRGYFGVPNSILVGLPVNSFIFEDDIPNSLRAYVTYNDSDSDVLGQVAQVFNNTISFGRSLKMNNILVNNTRTIIERGYFENNNNDAGYLYTQEVNGYERMVFSDLNYLINLTIPMNQESHLHITVIDSIEQPTSDQFILPTTQETEYYSLANFSDEIIQADETVYRCTRCLEYFGDNQVAFKSHKDQCKKDEKLSMAFCVRQTKCIICLNKFLQTSTSDIKFFPCGHILHKECFKRILRINSGTIIKCPNCQEEISEGWDGEMKF